MADNPRDILSEAVARNSATVLSLPSAGMLRHHKSRFLNEVYDGIWIESVPSEQALIDELITNAQPCGLSFKTGDQKVSFLSKLLKTESAFQVNATTSLPALLLARPAEVKAVQRRNNYRVRIHEDSNLRLKIWRIPEQARLKDKPVRAAELVAELRDISPGGMGVLLLPKDGEPPKILADERVRIALCHGEGEELLIEGRVRAPRPGPKADTIISGVQFKNLEEGMEGRQILSVLTKIIGAMNVDEVRRHRLGIS
jgi:c-di-GMP-binding flagellar brake protein YcgR